MAKVTITENREGIGIRSPQVSNTCGLHKNTKSNKTVFDLSGAAAEENLFTAITPCTLQALQITYIEATSADAGVAVNCGLIRGGTDDDDYFGTATSAVSTATGTTEAVTLLQTAMLAGDTLTAGHAGGKTGTGTCFVSVEYTIDDQSYANA